MADIVQALGQEHTPAAGRGPLPFKDLVPFEPRRFVPVDADLTDWEQLRPLFDWLEKGAACCATVPELEAWLRDWSELSAALAEEGARRYLASAWDTADVEASAAYLELLERVYPSVAEREFRLAGFFCRHPLRRSLPPDRYAVVDRDIELTVEEFRAENAALELEETRRVQSYFEITGAMRVTYRGEERSLPEMYALLEEPNRAIRREAWEVSAKRALAEADRLEELFDALLNLRGQIAANAGCQNYRDYAWRRLRRFDYSPEQCLELHAAIEREVLPAVRELQERRRSDLGVETLRPWDTEVDPAGLPLPRPGTGPSDLAVAGQRIFDRLDPTLGDTFRDLRARCLLDLESREGKAPGCCQVPLQESRVPFISLTPAGTHMDLQSLLHEAGHAFHTLSARTHPLLAYRTAPLEFSEVASLSMELIGGECLDAVYSPVEARRVRSAHLEKVLRSFLWIASLDAFQHWIYTHPGHARAERARAWEACLERFGGLGDWNGLERFRGTLWHEVPHLFQCPFYFIEYAIAWLGALQVWASWRSDPQASLAAYRTALALGGSRPLPELFAAAGCRFDTSGAALGLVVRLVVEELETLRASSGRS